tara:strand:- start:1911 stop:2351 length:441 start_codon:yes stop_codon:yes gene_type:complete
MVHDFERFPELTNAQMDLYYFESPHKQIFEDFTCECVKVHDGDTITVRWRERDFDFPIRFSNINAPELNEPRGREVQSWLETRILGETVDVRVNPRNRVGKFGRLIGNVIHGGMSLSEEMLRDGRVTTFNNRKEGKIPSIGEVLAA